MIFDVTITTIVHNITNKVSFFTKRNEQELVAMISICKEGPINFKFFSVDTCYKNGSYKGQIMISKHLLENSIIDVIRL